jgi:hypothetical protein
MASWTKWGYCHDEEQQKMNIKALQQWVLTTCCAVLRKPNVAFSLVMFHDLRKNRQKA